MADNHYIITKEQKNYVIKTTRLEDGSTMETTKTRHQDIFMGYVKRICDNGESYEVGEGLTEKEKKEISDTFFRRRISTETRRNTPRQEMKAIRTRIEGGGIKG